MRLATDITERPSGKKKAGQLYCESNFQKRGGDYSFTNGALLGYNPIRHDCRCWRGSKSVDHMLQIVAVILSPHKHCGHRIMGIWSLEMASREILVREGVRRHWTSHVVWQICHVIKHCQSRTAKIFQKLNLLRLSLNPETASLKENGTYCSSFNHLFSFSDFFWNSSDQYCYKVCDITYSNEAFTNLPGSGHERSLTQIKFNREGDLLFSASKDLIINVWFSHNGERLGTYEGHNGSVWTIDVDCARRCFLSLPNVWSVFVAQSRFLVSGAADNEMRLWSVQTGKCLFVWEFPTAVKRVAFNEDDDQVVCITEQRMGYQGAIRVFDINREGDGTNRESWYPQIICFAFKYVPPVQKARSRRQSFIPSARRPQFAPSPTSLIWS